MREKIIDYLVNQKRVINTKTIEEYAELMGYLDIYGFEWKNGGKPLKVDAFQEDFDKTCIDLEMLEENEIKIAYGMRLAYDIHKIEVVSFKEFYDKFIALDKEYAKYSEREDVKQLKIELISNHEKYKVKLKLKDIDFIDEDCRYLVYDLCEWYYFFSNLEEDEPYYQQTFTKQELKELKIWENNQFILEKVEE